MTSRQHRGRRNPGLFAKKIEADLIIEGENRRGEGGWEQLELQIREAVRRHCNAISAWNIVETWDSAQGG